MSDSEDYIASEDYVESPEHLDEDDVCGWLEWLHLTDDVMNCLKTAIIAHNKWTEAFLHQSSIYKQISAMLWDNVGAEKTIGVARFLTGICAKLRLGDHTAEETSIYRNAVQEATNAIRSGTLAHDDLEVVRQFVHNRVEPQLAEPALVAEKTLRQHAFKTSVEAQKRLFAVLNRKAEHMLKVQHKQETELCALAGETCDGPTLFFPLAARNQGLGSALDNMCFVATSLSENYPLYQSEVGEEKEVYAAIVDSINRHNKENQPTG